MSIEQRCRFWVIRDRVGQGRRWYLSVSLRKRPKYCSAKNERNCQKAVRPHPLRAAFHVWVPRVRFQPLAADWAAALREVKAARRLALLRRPAAHPNSGLPEFGHLTDGRSRIYPTSAERSVHRSEVEADRVRGHHHDSGRIKIAPHPARISRRSMLATLSPVNGEREEESRRRRAARQGIDRILNYSMDAGVFHRAGMP